MSTLAENAAAVKAAQVAIDAAIVAKGGTTTGGLTNAPAAIAALPSGGGRDEAIAEFVNRTISGEITIVQASQINAVSSLFLNCTRLTRVNIPTLYSNTGNLFNGCSSLVSVVMKGHNNMNNIFSGCTSLADVTYAGNIMPCTTVLSNNLVLNSVPTTCVFHCSDGKDVKYIEGSWVAVERS